MEFLTLYKMLDSNKTIYFEISADSIEGIISHALLNEICMHDLNQKAEKGILTL